MARRVLFLLALLVVLGGIALALFVVPARTCGMDEFDCFDSHNLPKLLTGLGAGIGALVIAVIGSFLPKSPRRGNPSGPR